MRARVLRANSPRAEKLVWEKISNRQLGGFKFSRQCPIGSYFVDFACREFRFVIEIDGATHSTDAEIAYDSRRTDYLQSKNYHVVRFNNADIFENLDGVLETILDNLRQMPLTPALSP